MLLFLLFDIIITIIITTIIIIIIIITIITIIIITIITIIIIIIITCKRTTINKTQRRTTPLINKANDIGPKCRGQWVPIGLLDA